MLLPSQNMKLLITPWLVSLSCLVLGLSVSQLAIISSFSSICCNESCPGGIK